MTLFLPCLTAFALVCGLSLIRQGNVRGWRESLLVLFAMVYGGVFLLSESLSLVNRFHRGPIAGIVAAVSIGVIVYAVRRKSLRTCVGIRPAWRGWVASLSRWERVALYVVVVALCVKVVEGLILPPTTQDALVYHIPRYLHWFEQGNLAFYDTAIQRQNYITPGFSLLLACADAIAGGDRLFHLVQFSSFLTLAAASTLLAGVYGAGVRGQTLTGILVCTVPVTLAQTTTVFCDILAAAPLVAFCYFYSQNLRKKKMMGHTLWAGVMAGLAVICKTQGLLYVPLLTLAMGGYEFIRSDWRGKKQLMGVTAVVALLAGCFVVPHTIRNHSYYGRFSGCAESETILRYPFSLTHWAYTQTCRSVDVSALPIPPLNRRIGHAIQSLFPICSRNPRLHFQNTSYAHGSGSLISATTGTFFLSCVVCLLGGVAALRNRDMRALFLLIGNIACFMAFSALIIWMPWDNRFFIGLFAIGVAVAVAALEKRWKSNTGRNLLAAAAVVFAIPAIFSNAATYVPAFAYAKRGDFVAGSGARVIREAVRDGSLLPKIITPPSEVDAELLHGYHYLLVPRRYLYWGAGTATQLFVRPAYTELVDFLQRAVLEGCATAITFFPYDQHSRLPMDWEYHYWRLTRESRPHVTFVAASRDYPVGPVSRQGKPLLGICARDALPPDTFLSGSRRTCVYTNRVFGVYRYECGESLLPSATCMKDK